MSSWFGAAASSGPNFHPVQLQFGQEALFGPLVKEDTEWLCPGGFVTETQTFYATTTKGGIVMAQVIHSSVGLWYPSIQFTFRYAEPSSSTHIWKSTPVTNFVVGPPGKDKRSSKSDQFTITVDPATPNKYTIEGKYDDEVQVSLVFESLTPGWKVGAGPAGGMSYFGALNKASATAKGPAPDTAAGGDGYAVHRFFPRCAVSGIMRTGKEVVDLAGSHGIFIHAIQGLRPNVLAAKWNFANFQSAPDAAESVALVMMEFETTPAYGSKKVNLGSIVVGDKLVAVTAGGDGVVGGSKAIHLNPVKDVETGYDAPSGVEYVWEGASLFEGKTVPGSPPSKASFTMDLLTSKPGEDYQTKGLVEKVDVLGQIPYLVKKFVNYAAGTKPYIYTWLNPVTAKVTIPADLATPTATETKELTVAGTVFVEATYIS